MNNIQSVEIIKIEIKNSVNCYLSEKGSLVDSFAVLM